MKRTIKEKALLKKHLSEMRLASVLSFFLQASREHDFEAQIAVHTELENRINQSK